MLINRHETPDLDGTEFEFSTEGVLVLDRMIDGKEIKSREDALRSLLVRADVELKASGR